MLQPVRVLITALAFCYRGKKNMKIQFTLSQPLAVTKSQVCSLSHLP